MYLRSLYPLLVLCVLLLSNCRAEEGSGAPEMPANPDRTDTASFAQMLPDTSDAGTIVVLGNSLAAGLGLDPEQAFPALLQKRIDALGWNFQVINAGLSGETTAGGLRRIDWLLRQPVDVLIIELGGNDGLRGIPIEVTRANLQGIIDKARERYPEIRIILAGMQIPPNLGQDYAARFRELYPEIAARNNVGLIPFLLEGVGGVATLNQADGIHPTAEGQRILSENVWQTLKPVIESMQPEAA